jgi:integrase
VTDSNRTPRPRKAADRPKKPYHDFPLSPHASGAWQKKIRGKIHYFGKWAHRVNGKLVRVPGDGWEDALARYKAVADDLHAGRTPRVTADGLTVANLCNRFLTAKHHQLAAGEVTPRTFAEYKATTDRLVARFGKNRLADDLASDDFEALRAELAERYGPVRLGNEIQRVRTVFRYAAEAGLLDQPVRYGPAFKKPSAGVLRRHRAAAGERLFGADELRRLIDDAGVPLKAMILLGVNAGFGNADCGTLPLSALDLDGGWVTFPRPKTGVPRRCPLWPETVAAIRDALADRPEPKDPAAAGLVFVTRYGRPWSADGTSDAVTLETGKLLRRAGLHRPGLGFYTLRHTFRTVADATRDFPAVRLVMGHADASIDAVYRERIDDARLKAVTEHVRNWLWQRPAAGGAG